MGRRPEAPAVAALIPTDMSRNASTILILWALWERGSPEVPRNVRSERACSVTPSRPQPGEWGDQQLA